MAKRKKKEGTRKVYYDGPLSRVSVPGRPTSYVDKGVTIEVSESHILCAYWRDAEEPKTTAPEPEEG